MGDSDDSVSSSSSSDNEFLTMGAGKGGEPLDREALVRKKLLENFYGREAVADAGPIESMDLGDDDDDDDDDLFGDEGSPSKRHGAAAASESVSDMDSPAFDAEAHSKYHVTESSMQTLLDTEERLAHSSRTLDTEMQALVYENYTRFIDATDAIKSIGVNVKANEPGLESLASGMAAIDANSKIIEESLGSLRDQVAEKIRIKRLLTRLDTLLKLPKTLREQIANGDCRSACKQFLQASSILKKHSEGFESLRSIETECNAILEELKTDLERKLALWSGQAAINDDQDELHEIPQSMRDIFECSGTLHLLLESSDDWNERTQELQAMSLTASMRLFDRLLDTHMIEVEEQRYSLADMETPSASDMNLGASMNSIPVGPETDCVRLVPRDILASILEVATLWATSFGEQVAGNDAITQFVSEAFSSFLMQEKALFMDDSTEETAQDEGETAVGKGLSVALDHLLKSVQDLAQGLVQPTTGFNPVFASSLVEQTKSLTDVLVRRRVDQKFMRLRASVVENCLLPFVSKSIQERKDSIASGKVPREGIVRIANVTLSDCIQLVDDTIRSVFATSANKNAEPNGDMSAMKLAVQASITQFTAWLANAFEMLAGGESCDLLRLIDANAVEPPSADSTWASPGSSVAKQSFSFTNVDFTVTNARELTSLIDDAFNDILAASGDGVDFVHSDFVLSIAEMCRLAQGSMSDMLEQSLLSHVGGHKKKTKGMFEDGKMVNDDFLAITQRFHVASSRLLIQYAANKGSVIADKLHGIIDSDVDGESISAPRDCVLDALEVVRQVADECSDAFGERGWTSAISNTRKDTFTALPAARKTGLHLDVERMFKEKIDILPHPSAVITRHPCDVIFLAFKVAFKALLERMRTCSISGPAYRQLQVDVEFLKLMVTHFVKTDYAVDGSNACTTLNNLLSDVMYTAGERCMELGTAESEQVKRECMDIAFRFLNGKGKDGIVERIMVQQQPHDGA